MGRGDFGAKGGENNTIMGNSCFLLVPFFLLPFFFCYSETTSRLPLSTPALRHFGTMCPNTTLVLAASSLL